MRRYQQTEANERVAFEGHLLVSLRQRHARTNLRNNRSNGPKLQTETYIRMYRDFVVYIDSRKECKMKTSC